MAKLVEHVFSTSQTKIRPSSYELTCLEVGSDMSDAIDWAHLDQQTMGEDEIAREVLKLFVQHLDAASQTLSVDDAELGDKVHKLKGSARGVGAWNVAEVADRFVKPQADVNADLEDLKLSMQMAKQAALTKLDSF
jgi:HPt (histidine-containing phosphotransfer) domain-containing protein